MKKISMHGFGLFKDTSLHRHYAAGEIIFQAGDESDKMYVVVEGELRFMLHGNEVDVLTAGDLFGEMGVVENRLRNGSVTAVTDCTLILIDRPLFAALIHQYPDFAPRVMSVTSARLSRRTEVELKKRALEHELDVGRRMQLSLLPQTTPTIPGWQFASYYQPAWQVGGDFYDFIHHENNPSKLSLVIADVTGKGVPAALYMAVARTLIRAETGKTNSAVQVLQRVNELIINDNQSPLFLSAFYAILDVETGKLLYASAGHDPPLCLRQATSLVEALPTRGFLLGAFYDLACHEETSTLAVGDVLLLYTDGVTEARDEAGGFFGEERLKVALKTVGKESAEDIVDGIVTAVSQFIGSRDQADDLTILVAKRVPT